MFNIDIERAELSSYGSLKMSELQAFRLKRATDQFIEEFDGNLADTPAVFKNPNAENLESWLAPPPEHSQVTTDEQIQQLLETIAAATSTGFETAGGSMLSYIPGNELRSASLARHIAAVQNRFTGVSAACPGAVALEQSVINWMTTQFGLGKTSGGVLLSGATMANFSAVVTARNRFGEDFQDGLVYVSASTHHSALKACRLAGIPKNNIQCIPLDDQFCMDSQALEKQLQADSARGNRPMMIIATAGTTDTGAIDPLEECAALAHRFEIWLHVDAAYGGFFTLTDRGQKRLAGIERANSITVDAHKGLFMPFGLGALLVADRRSLFDAHSGSAAYLRDLDNVDSLPNFSELGPELTRPFRGLELWFPLHLHGVAAFQQELDRMLDITEVATEELGAIPALDVVTSPSLSIVCFRCLDGDSATQGLLAKINESGIAHVSSSCVGDSLVIRLVFLSFRFEMKRWRALFEVLCDFTSQLHGNVASQSKCA